MTEENRFTYQGVRPISWQDFHGICRALAAAAADYKPELILAVGRGGFYPGTLLAHMLRVDICPVRLTRREADVVVRPSPRWLLEPPAALVAGRRVLIVDEISSSGETLTVVREKTAARGARAVRSAVLYAHTPGVAVPDYVGLVSDELLLNPWDREVWVDGRFTFHPEYAAVLANQGLTPTADMRIQAPAFRLAKRP
ncbi:MAG: hypothetical protein KC425_22590 [Anaerolineales bacterium]|nr:hypothetical protein [Anaerolineales bacterium]